VTGRVEGREAGGDRGQRRLQPRRLGVGDRDPTVGGDQLASPANRRISPATVSKSPASFAPPWC